jgi:LPXTG-site transpeptidase (sortase) family protein
MSEPIFNEEDLKRFFGQKNKEETPISKPVAIEFQPETPKNPEPFFEPQPFKGASLLPQERSSIFQLIWRFLGTFILIFIISYSLINAPALALKIRYFWDTQYHSQRWDTNFNIPPVTSQSRLIIPKIKTNAPISWNVPPDQITQKLENGVAHYEGTALPGQVGNIFITGHSSYYIWAPGSYKDVFALLNQLYGGDKIYIQYGGTQFTYEVTGQVVVDPSDTSVLTQGNEKMLSLMTCVPVGTNLKRLVVTAKQVGS